MAFAVVNASIEVCDLLLKNNARLDTIDHLGNGVVHLCVLHGRQDKLEYFMKSCPDEQKSALRHKNRMGFTPLLLAAYVRSKHMFKAVELACGTQLWTFGGTRCSRHELADLDSLIPRPSGTRSLIQLMVKHNLIECLTPVVSQLLHDKWEQYARNMYHIMIVLYWVDLAFLCATVSGGCALGITFGLTMLIHVLPHCVRLLRYLCRGSTSKRVYTKDSSQVFFARILSTCYGISIITANAIAMGLSEDWRSAKEDHSKHVQTALAVASVLGWVHFLLFLRGLQFVGPSLMMLHTMILSDAAEFSTIYFCALLGFSQALYTQFAHSEEYANLPEVTPILLFGELD